MAARWTARSMVRAHVRTLPAPLPAAEERRLVHFTNAVLERAAIAAQAACVAHGSPHAGTLALSAVRAHRSLGRGR